MGRIPKKVLEEILDDPYYTRCAREDETCNGRITFDHCVLYAGKQIQKKWAILPVCWAHHLGKRFNRNVNTAIALSRATDEDLAKYPKLDIDRLRAFQKLFLPKIPGQ